MGAFIEVARKILLCLCAFTLFSLSGMLGCLVVYIGTLATMIVVVKQWVELMSYVLLPLADSVVSPTSADFHSRTPRQALTSYPQQSFGSKVLADNQFCKGRTKTACSECCSTMPVLPTMFEMVIGLLQDFCHNLFGGRKARTCESCTLLMKEGERG